MNDRSDPCRKALDVARRVKRGIELCAQHCRDDGDAHWAELLSNARTGHVRFLRQMVEKVYSHEPAPWSLADEKAVHLAWTVLELLEVARLETCKPVDAAA
jgi:hypothetical protein